MTEEQALAALTEKEAELASEYNVDVSYKTEKFSITATDLDLTFNTEEVLEEAKARSNRISSASSGGTASEEPLALEPTFSFTAVKKKISDFAEKLIKIR